MKSSLRFLPVLALLLAIFVLPATAPLEATSQFRSAEASEATFPNEAFGLTVDWKRPLGSGYSNIWLEDELGITMHTDGEVDVVAAFSLDEGTEVWRYELGPKYTGHDGSDDGPIGTPTVSKGLVHALGPAGQLVALDLATGSETWRRDLGEADSTVPFYGYTSSPVVTTDLVLVATGGEGHAITAFDRESGETRWTVGDDAIAYQTPMIMDLGGREQAILPSNQFLQGIDPESGEMLWQIRHSEGQESSESAHPTAVDGDRFLVKYDRDSRLYSWNGSGVDEVWQSRAFANTYALPVLIGDHFYGFTGSVLTCASVETGEIVWRSRGARSFGIAEIGGHLAITTREGELLLVKASPEGYQEVSRTPVLEVGDYAIPVFADGHFFIRNLTELASVSLDTTAAPQVAEIQVENRYMGDFGKWVAKIEKKPAAQRQALVDEYFSQTESTPITEGSFAHFVWRGEAEDVGLQGDVAVGGEEVGLLEVEDTDLFFRSLELSATGQYSYSFIVDFGRGQADSENPYSIDNGFAVSSELRMTEWPASPHLDMPADDAPRGQIDRFQFRSAALGNAREIQVWRPPGYGTEEGATYPVLVVNHGDNLLRGGLMDRSLDNLVGQSVAPLIAVFVPRASGAEYGGESADSYNRFLIEELLPHIDRHYLSNGETRTIMGPGSAGVAAVYAALRHPEIFAKAAAQSFYPIEPAQGQITELIAGDQAKPEVIYLAWSQRDYDLGDDRKAADTSLDLRDRLENGGVPVEHQIFDYSPGWGGWRGQHDEILRKFFPLETSEE